ncbi:ABC transporter ATP-binding protein [Billgrantia azerbaijanica]|nr:ABC transporter ATP-binding protein [Halomonas azerbaijanica]
MTLPTLVVNQAHVKHRLAVDGPLRAPAGSITALLGPNGAGKSTLLKALAGIEGAALDARLGDRQLAGLPALERHRVMHYLPQLGRGGARLSVHEAVLLSLKTLSPGRVSAQDLARVREALASLHLLPLAQHSLDRLSGGQYQRVAIAQAMVRRPEALLLDEPTSALDLHQQLRVLEWLRREADQGRTVLVALHDLNLAARFADHCWLLKQGRCLHAGPARECLVREHLEPLFEIHLNVQQDAGGTTFQPLAVRQVAPRE